MLTPLTLRGSFVCLEPMTVDHVEALCRAASGDTSTYSYTNVPNGREAADRYIENALLASSQGRALPFVVRRMDTGDIVGSTRFQDLEYFTCSSCPPESSGTNTPTVAEIGSTWYTASAQRTAVNTECKLLMLSHAFETWHTIRVTLKTDARNMRSRQAIERLGAVFEGIRRAHMPASDGSIIRDTVYYSILVEEWPVVKANLLERLHRGLIKT